MKMKKVLALVLAGLMTASLAACGSSDEGAATTTDTADTTTETTDTADVATDETAEASELSGHLTIWTWTEDLKTKAEKFMEANPGVEIETVIIATADYPTKVEAALGAGDDSIDVFGGEPQMIPAFMEAGFFEDLDAAPYNFEDYADQLFDYVNQVGKYDGTQYCIGYQSTPAAFYYRRSIAKEVLGTDDPEEVAKYFSSYPVILETAQTMLDAGYKMFASDSELGYMTGDEAWVVDGALNLAQARLDYMDLVDALYRGGYTTFSAQWATPWYQAMNGPVAVLTAEVQWGDWGTDENGNTNFNIWDAENYNANVDNYATEEAEVFAFGLPAWGILTLTSNATETVGDWGVCEGPAYGFGGGTWVGISSQSKNKELAWEFVKYATIDEGLANWWISEKYAGDAVSNIAAMEAHYDDEIAFLGGQKVYPLWAELSEGIDYSKVTVYDQAIGDAWGSAISKVKTGEATKDDAIAAFYDEVAATYPDLTINK